MMVAHPFEALCCIACGAPGLAAQAAILECPACSRAYPIAADIPIMFSDATLRRGPMLPPDVVQAVLRSMELPPDPAAALRVRRASAAQAAYGDALVAAEAAQFLRRVHASGYPIPAEWMLAPPPPPSTDGQPACRWLTDYIPRALPPGQTHLANIRFQNTGPAALPHEGHGRATVAFTWTDEQANPVPTADDRTPLPVTLQPGQALTLPVRIVTPDEPGRYGLTVHVVREGVCWMQPAHGPLRIAVREGAGFTPPGHWAISAHRPAGYLADQARGVALLQDWLAAGPASPRLLEIGGNARPVAAQLDAVAHNVDVDLLGLQVGQIAHRGRGQPIGFVCADAHRLPFAEGYFDAIVMFATLHHAADPAALLRRLRGHLRPGGFIGVFCEPIGQIWPGAASQAFAEELQHGVNEQGFSLAEYAQIFAAAGLQADALAADFNSLKARLSPRATAAPPA